MSLNHDFLIVEKSDLLENGYQQFFNSKDAALLHDDFIEYIYDSLLWVPSIDEKGTPLDPLKGLNRWGVNFYDSEGAKKLKVIISSWIEIFKCGPETLNLKGSWTYYNQEDDDYKDEGDYERLILNRDNLLTKLTKLVDWSDEVIQSNGTKLIFHMGV